MKAPAWRAHPSARTAPSYWPPTGSPISMPGRPIPLQWSPPAHAPPARAKPELPRWHTSQRGWLWRTAPSRPAQGWRRWSTMVPTHSKKPTEPWVGLDAGVDGNLIPRRGFYRAHALRRSQSRGGTATLDASRAQSPPGSQRPRQVMPPTAFPPTTLINV